MRWLLLPEQLVWHESECESLVEENRMKELNKTHLMNYVCAILLVLLFATQFLPFWNCTADCKDHKDIEKTVSIAEYVWHPDHHKPITKGMTDVYMEAHGEDFTREDGKKFKFELNDIAAPLVVMFAGSVVGAVLCVMYSKRILPALIPFVVGSIGVYWYLTCPAMQVGQNWMLHMGIAILTTIAALAAIVVHILDKLKIRKAS